MYPLQKVQVGNSPTYIVGRRLGKGGFGQVYAGYRISSIIENNIVTGPGAHKVAIKFECGTGCNYAPPNEWRVYEDLGGTLGVPSVHYTGRHGQLFVMIMDMLGPSLCDAWMKLSKEEQISNWRRIAVEAITILKNLHSKGYVHGDIKAENFLFGLPDTADQNKLFLADLGLASTWIERANGSHIEYDQQLDYFSGTVPFASVHAHLGRSRTRRDDLESLVYMLILLFQGRLPWENLQGNREAYVLRKMRISIQSLCKNCPTIIVPFVERIMRLGFYEEPDYENYISLLKGTIPHTQNTSITEKAGHKRGRFVMDAPHNAVGQPSVQWISVFEPPEPGCQRYYYNVPMKHISKLIEDRKAENLLITSIASSKNQWALVFNTESGLSSQVYNLSPQFLNKEWIIEKWQKDYYISAIAGADDGYSLVVMSKGTCFTHQAYKTSDTFPYKWIKERWYQGMYITSMATSGSRWAVVMSIGKLYYNKQVVELDFGFPSEGLNIRYNNGYVITAVAATPDKAAFALSLPGEKSVAKTQKTLLTTDFPRIKDECEQYRHLKHLCFGRVIMRDP